MTAVLREDFIGGAKPTTLATNLLAGATSLSVAAGGLATWTPVVHGRIPVVIARGMADEERVYATAVSGDSLTGLLRGQDGTVDQAHAPGATVEVGLFATHVDEPNRFLSLPTAAGQFAVSDGPDSWGAPTSSPAITDFTNAPHDHGDADDGGGLAAGIALTTPVIASFVNANHTHAATGATGGSLPTGEPSASAPGDTSAMGAAGAYARSGHRHPRESFGAPSASAVGDAAVTGAGPSVAAADHVHAREGFGPIVQSSVLNNTASNGSAGQVARSDHDHGYPAAAPRGTLLDAKITVAPAAVSAETVVAGLSGQATPGSGTRRLKVAFTGLMSTSAANDLVRIRIRNGLTTAGTELARGQVRLPAAGGSGEMTLTVFTTLTVTGGIQDFCVTLERAAGTGAETIAATATNPAVLLVEDIGT